MPIFYGTEGHQIAFATRGGSPRPGVPLFPLGAIGGRLGGFSWLWWCLKGWDTFEGVCPFASCLYTANPYSPSSLEGAF